MNIQTAVYENGPTAAQTAVNLIHTDAFEWWCQTIIRFARILLMYLFNLAVSVQAAVKEEHNNDFPY